MTEIYVQIDGGKHQQQLLVQDIVNWFTSKYFKRFKSFTIEIDLLEIDGKVNGWCYEQEPKYCCVEIDKRQKGDDFITCVLHELIHVKQYFKKELRDINGVEMRWKGETHICIDYYNLPWEKEAYQMQEVLLKEYKERFVGT